MELVGAVAKVGVQATLDALGELKEAYHTDGGSEPDAKEEAERLVKALAPHPVMINVLPNGLTGNYTVEDCKRLGFKLAIYPCTGFSTCPARSLHDTR